MADRRELDKHSPADARTLASAGPKCPPCGRVRGAPGRYDLEVDTAAFSLRVCAALVRQRLAAIDEGERHGQAGWSQVYFEMWHRAPSAP